MTRPDAQLTAEQVEAQLLEQATVADHVQEVLLDHQIYSVDAKLMGRKLREIVAALRSLAQPAVEPVAWVIPGDDNARNGGFLDAMAWQEGEFTRPLYAAPPQPAPQGDTEYICPKCGIRRDAHKCREDAKW